MPYKFLGTYKNYNVYKGARSKDDVPYHDPGNIYLAPAGNGNYWMILNGRICGTCDSRYCVEEFYEPAEREVEELNFTASSWTTDPNPQVVEDEEPMVEEEPSSSDFWTRVQEEINAVLNSVNTTKPEPFKFDFQ